MKSLILAGWLAFFIAASSARAGQVTMEYTFERPEITQVTIDGVNYHRLAMPDAPNAGMPGRPALPAQGARLLLPPGAEVSAIEVTTGEKIALGRNYYIEPVTQEFRLSVGPTRENLPHPDQSIYSSGDPYPAERFANVSTHGFRGYQIIVLKLQPVEYIPATGELAYYPRLLVTITTNDTGERSPLFRGMPVDRQEIEGKVDNPGLSTSYPELGRIPGANYDLLILTTSSLAASFLPLKEYHDSTGTPTEIHTTAEVGSSNPDAVRDYVRERYLADGISYVLIGGDDELIPARDMMAGGDPTIPVDIYFGCLDGTFNYDGDGYWGEPTDGENGGEVDLVAEVCVGRASVENTAEAQRFVQKTLMYLSSRQWYLTKVLMCGEYLWDGIVSYGCQYMDELIGTCSNHKYTTVGVPVTYAIDKLYDRDWPGHDWPAYEVYNRLNNGVHLVNHLGHGNTYWALKSSPQNMINALSTNQLFFLFSQACYSGNFDGPDCWAEQLTIKTDHGAFALVMNARYGYGSSTSTDGMSQRYHREFLDAIFNPLDYKPQLGRALQDAREDNLYRISDGVMRYGYYEVTLFGDPAITFGLEKGGADDITIYFPHGVPDTVLPGIPATFEVEILPIWEGTPLAGTELLHYSVNGEPEETVPLVEVSRLHYSATLPGILCEDLLQYYVSAQVAGGDVRYYPQPSEPLTPIVNSNIITVFGDNFAQDLGWSISGDATDGHWERRIPSTMGLGCTPNVDYDDSRLCYLTGADADLDGGHSYLDSPPFDLSGGNAQIRYALWYCNDTGGDTPTDIFVTYISNNNGADWIAAETFGPDTLASGGWQEHEFWAGDFVAPTDQMRLRFEVADLGDDSIIEAAVDAVRILMYECKNCDCAGYCDLNGDESINPLDVAYIVNYVYRQLDSRQALAAICPYANGDWDCSGQVTPLDVAFFVNYVYRQIGGGPNNPCAAWE
jgi:hypothetical protein